MKKKLVKVFAATALFAGLLAGCGADSSGSGASSSGSGDTIKIGLNLELSGGLLHMVQGLTKE